MPTYGTTAKRTLRYLLGENKVKDVDAGFLALAQDVDDRLGSAGKSIIATSEARTNTAYGLLTTPDRVTGVVLPTSGLIAVAYQATWQESVATAGRAAVFLASTQLKRNVAGSGPVVQEAFGASAAPRAARGIT
jgi:hypothetical protein